MRVDIPFMPGATPIEAVRGRFTPGAEVPCLVGSRESWIGVVAPGPVRRGDCLRTGRRPGQLGSRMVSPFMCIPTIRLTSVLERLAQSGGVLPVVDRQGRGQVCGVITPADIATAASRGRGNAPVVA